MVTILVRFISTKVNYDNLLIYQRKKKQITKKKKNTSQNQSSNSNNLCIFFISLHVGFGLFCPTYYFCFLSSPLIIILFRSPPFPTLGKEGEGRGFSKPFRRGVFLFLFFPVFGGRFNNFCWVFRVQLHTFQKKKKRNQDPVQKPPKRR